jgi:hypothetical protein
VTDPRLVHRAERAYLGALLARHGRSGAGTVVAGDSGQAPALTPRDFTDPVHQAIFTALTSPQPSGIAAWYERLRGLLTRLFSQQARAAAAYMAGLPALCPDPAHLPAYAAMVTESSQDRTAQERVSRAGQAASEDPTLASAGAWLDATGAAQRASVRRWAVKPAVAGTGPEVPTAAPAQAAQGGAAAASLPDDASTGPSVAAARLAWALRANARRATRPDPAPAPGTGRLDENRTPVRREELEDRILASLMKHSGEGKTVTEWLPAQAFSTVVHRDLYDLIRQRLASGRPVDPLIIAWDAGHLPDIPSAAEYGGAPSLADAAIKIGELDPAPGSAEVLGRAIWADRVLTETHGQDWPAAPDRSWLPGASTPSNPERQAAAAAAASRSLSATPETQPQRANGVAEMDLDPLAPEIPAPARPTAPRPVPLQQPPAPVSSGPVLRM